MQTAMDYPFDLTEKINQLNRIIKEGPLKKSTGRLTVGVDLGTTSIVLVVLDGKKRPVAGAIRYAKVVRDGVVADFWQAVQIVKELKAQLEDGLQKKLQYAAAAFPPGIPTAETRAVQFVLESAELEVTNLLDEPSAANTVLEVKDGAIVDIGGGSTGVGVFQQGRMIYSGDEPTGGIHMSMVIAGSLKVTMEEAEKMKQDEKKQQQLFPVVKPVMEKMGAVVASHVRQHIVGKVFLVGGASCFKGIDRVIEEVVGIPVVIPTDPLMVTPLGIALSCWN